MNSAATTSWELKLKDLVLGPLKKLADMGTMVQGKINGVQGGLNKLSQMSNNMMGGQRRNYLQLEERLNKLKELQLKAFDVKHIQNYQKAIAQTEADMAKLSAHMTTKQSKWQEFKAGFASQIPGIGGMLGLATNPYTLAMAGAVAIGTATTKLALNYETGMAKINATAQLPTETLGKLKDRLVEIGSTSGGNFELMPAAYEKILSQTGKVNLSLDILETSVKGAKAGFTDIDTVAGALAQTLSVVGEQNTTAKEVLDTLMMAKGVGAGEFGDFAQYMPQLIAAGNNLHIGFKDVAGLFSYMTAKGQSAADSAMLLQNAFTALQKKEIIKGLSANGIKLFDEKGMRRNITEVFTELSKKISTYSDRKKTQFFLDIGLNDAQARNAFSVLTSDADKFRSIMGDVNNSLGETDRQLAATANTARSWGDIGDQLKAMGTSIGEYLIPVIDVLLQGIMEFGRGIKAIFSKDWWANFLGGVDAGNEVLRQARIQAAHGAALSSANKVYGVYKPGESMELTRSRNEFMINQSDQILKSLNGNTKNVIVANEGKSSKEKSTKMAALDNSNIGATATESEKSKLSGTGSSGNRSLVQNINVTINIKKGSDEDIEKTKRQLTDLIVDSARDGIVTVGV